MTRVRGVIAAARRSISSHQPPWPSVSGIDTTFAPPTVTAPRKFGQAGSGTMTSSPVPATMRIAIWIACMPPCVTKKRSGENGRP